MSSELPKVFKILNEDVQYNEIVRRFSEETNIRMHAWAVLVANALRIK